MHFLLIIDMQHTFAASQRVCKQVARQVRVAKACGHHIILAEYCQASGTCPDVLAVIGRTDYDRVVVCADDKADHILREVNSRVKSSDLVVFRVCGVNTSSCVKATVNSLRLRRRARVEVLSAACADARGESSHNRALARLDMYHNVTVV